MAAIKDLSRKKLGVWIAVTPSFAFDEMKREVERRCGVDFKLKDFRSTLASMTADNYPTMLPRVSAQLRHADIKTTKEHYARIEQGAAIMKLQDRWRSNSIFDTTAPGPAITHEPPSIDRKFEQSGYA